MSGSTPKSTSGSTSDSTARISPIPAHTDPATFPVRDLEQGMVRSTRLAAACRLVDDTEEAELHSMWADILLDEWARRKAA